MLVQWGEDSRRCVWVESYNRKGPWVIAVHGGAWQDPKITYKSAFKLLEHVDKTKLGGVASVEYQLSPDVIDPMHAQDVCEGIKIVLDHYEPTEIVLVGHSCGAFLCGQAYDEFKTTVKSIIGVEGIYNLKSLVKEYPDYRSFVVNAFGEDEEEWPLLDWAQMPVTHVIQSREDELLSPKQSEEVCALLGKEIDWLPAGKHDEVWEERVKEWAPLCTDF